MVTPGGAFGMRPLACVPNNDIVPHTFDEVPTDYGALSLLPPSLKFEPRLHHRAPSFGQPRCPRTTLVRVTELPRGEVH
jgi:hypothetical protein